MQKELDVLQNIETFSSSTIPIYNEHVHKYMCLCIYGQCYCPERISDVVFRLYIYMKILFIVRRENTVFVWFRVVRDGVHTNVI